MYENKSRNAPEQYCKWWYFSLGISVI